MSDMGMLQQLKPPVDLTLEGIETLDALMLSLRAARLRALLCHGAKLRSHPRHALASLGLPVELSD
jgi:hypothetical protein